MVNVVLGNRAASESFKDLVETKGRILWIAVDLKSFATGFLRDAYQGARP